MAVTVAVTVRMPLVRRVAGVVARAPASREREVRRVGAVTVVGRRDRVLAHTINVRIRHQDK